MNCYAAPSSSFETTAQSAITGNGSSPADRAWCCSITAPATEIWITTNTCSGPITGISTNASDGEVNEVVAFGFAVTEFLQTFKNLVRDRPTLAHFHEWMGGVAVPRIAHLRIPVATIFTTHATLLGRYLAGDNPYFYEHLPFINPEAEAKRYDILPRYQIEKAATHASTVFTTVSEVTARGAASTSAQRAVETAMDELKADAPRDSDWRRMKVA